MRKKTISKEEIVVFAEEILRKEGLEALSMRKIAGKAEVSVGTLYNYFPSNRSLLEEVFYFSWNKTHNLLKDLPFHNKPPFELFTDFYILIEDEIRSRYGIGKKLFDSTAFNYKESVSYSTIFLPLRDTLFKIIKQDKKYNNYSEKDCYIITEWILLIVLNSITKMRLDKELVFKEIKQRFF
ncbi:TetR/AcrR family transcriptional regulator [Mycoplasmatota bacterium]|nr:TetR/AcrR family transcriptional regulator [Mycoplasmatota bacterium]